MEISPKKQIESVIKGSISLYYQVLEEEINSSNRDEEEKDKLKHLFLEVKQKVLNQLVDED